LAESCEYRRHFLNYNPEYLIITNIDFDHPDYFRDLQDVILAFQEMAEKISARGHLFISADDPNCLLIQSKAPITTFGLSSAADIRATEICYKDEVSTMKIFVAGKYAGDLTLNVYGKHNILNALAAIAFCQKIGLPLPRIFQSLSQYTGTKRRFEHLGVRNGAMIVDDYAHHPTEIRTTLEGARLSFPNRRIRAIFQPHTFSRTEKFLQDFSSAFHSADEVVIADIFASAREKDTHTVSALTLAEMIQKQGTRASYIGTIEAIKSYVVQTLAADDLVLTLGAGDIYKVGQDLVC
jgi:UDP-N-acetylmuramate--alanine ligase